MDKKYELVKDSSINYFNHKLYRIKALKDFGDVKKGDLGGYVENECNLDQEEDCWVDEDAKVFGNAKVSDNAEVFNRAMVCGKALVSDNAVVCGNARIAVNAKVYGNATIFDNARVYGNAEVFGIAWVCDNVKIFDNAKVYGNAWVYDSVKVFGDAEIFGDTKVYGSALVLGAAWIHGDAEITHNTQIKSSDDYLVFKNTWSSGRYFTYTKSNKMWKVGCFYGTGEELIKKAYKDSKESGDKYKATVQYVETIMN